MTIAPRDDDAADFRFGPSVRLPMIRGDLKITSAPLRGRDSFVVKDPVSLKYFRWGARERHLAGLLDGRRSAAEVIRLIQREFPGEDFHEADLQNVMNRFLQAGLLITDGSVAQRLFHQQRRSLQKAKRSRLWLTIPSKLISFKITLFDPDLLLLRLDRRLRFLWTWPTVVVLVAMLATAGWLLTLDTGSLAARMPEILGWQNLVILWIVLILVKVVHEFGHGLACKHFGGEVHEMGAMFILFSPFLFCNATDSWVFREKWKRMTVNFAGIYLELFLASAAAALWVLTQPGIFNQVCFNVMLVCSVTTIFFNVNPLMKFDGYYALSDALEIPNLKERGDRALVTRLAGLFTGGEGIASDPIVDSLKSPILAYAAASYAWTFLVAYRMLQAMGYLLEPAGLDRLAQSAAGMVLIAGLLTPPFLVGMQVTRVVKAGESAIVSRRVVVSLAIFVASIALLALIPVPVSVKSACVVDAGNRIRITAPVPGFLRTIHAREAQSVAAGEVLAVLQNPDLDKNQASTSLMLEAARIQEASVIENRGDRLLPGIRALAAEYAASDAKNSSEAASQMLRSPEAGIVVGKGLALKSGSFLQRGELFCEILPKGPLQAIVALSENESTIVRPGQNVSFRLHSFSGETFSGRVLSVAPSPLEALPHQSLGQNAGGTVPSIMSGSPRQTGVEATPSGLVYKARVAIDNPDGLLRPGMSGRIRISCGTRPLGASVVQWIRSMLRTDFQL